MRAGCVILIRKPLSLFNFIRYMATGSKAIILGAFASKTNTFSLTTVSKAFDYSVQGKLTQMLRSTNFDGKVEKARYFYHLSPEYTVVIVAGLGDENSGYCPNEEIDLKSENIRLGFHNAGCICKDLELDDVWVDDCDRPKVIGEITSLINYRLTKWKTGDQKRTPIKFTLKNDKNIATNNLFEEGTFIGKSQNFTALHADAPANQKTPTVLAQDIVKAMPPEVHCIIRDKEWIKAHNMNLFLSVNQGSVEPPVLCEFHYKGADVPPIVLVGKGITFDSGGISLKPSANMADMKADMQGAASVAAAVRACAQLKLKVHVIAITPFTENLPSGSATKPGDVFLSMQGKSVEVDNTDAEGRLILADALTYAHTFLPSQIIDLATLTGAVGVALGSAASAIYTNSPKMLKDFQAAGAISGDRVWRMPLYKYYSKMIKSTVADLVNCTKKREAGSCTAASFLSEFVTVPEWAHLDIAGVMTYEKECMPYGPSHMSGRPTRTLVEYLKSQQLY